MINYWMEQEDFDEYLKKLEAEQNQKYEMAQEDYEQYTYQLERDFGKY